MFCLIVAFVSRRVRLCTLLVCCALPIASIATEPPVDLTGEAAAEKEQDNTQGVISERVRAEREDAFNPYVITAHKHNFFLPFSYTSNINEDAYQLEGAAEDGNYQPFEVNFQISLKTQVNEKSLLFAGDAVYLGITIESWWQLYNSELSSPFRETNYQPEMYYVTPLVWGPFGGKTVFMFGIEHQSNGQLAALSRSWNRLYATLIYERGSFVASLRPWYRLPEDEKLTPDAAEGDDNPDILNYLGYGELSLGWRYQNYELQSVLKGNTTTGKGSLDTTLTFPLHGKFRGMVQYFNGYGDSLIDYDRFQHRIGFGVALTNLF